MNPSIATIVSVLGREDTENTPQLSEEEKHEFSKEVFQSVSAIAPELQQLDQLYKDSNQDVMSILTDMMSGDNPMMVQFMQKLSQNGDVAAKLMKWVKCVLIPGMTRLATACGNYQFETALPPLHNAIKLGDESGVRYLIEEGISDPLEPSPEYGNTAFHMAAVHGLSPQSVLYHKLVESTPYSGNPELINSLTNKDGITVGELFNYCTQTSGHMSQ